MKSSIRIACLILALSLLTTACGPGQQQGQNDGNMNHQGAQQNQRTADNMQQNRGFINNQNQDRTGRIQHETREDAIRRAHDEETDTDHNWGVTEAPQTQNETANAQKIADRLVKIAARLDEVNDATAVVAGRWAIVGIDVDAQLDRERVGTIKYTVAEALKSDPYGAYAIVTADIDTNYRLRQIAKEIRGGQPVEGFMDELAAIIGRIMPQVPRDIAEPEDPEADAQDQQTRRDMEGNDQQPASENQQRNGAGRQNQ